MKIIYSLGLLCISLFAIPNLLAQEKDKTNSPTKTASQEAGDKAWKQLEESFRPPVPPAEWREKRPSKEQIETFRNSQRDLAVAAADKAKEFHTTYPNHSKVDEARTKEREMLGFAVQLGATNQVARLEKLDQEKLKDPKLSEDDRFE